MKKIFALIAFIVTLNAAAFAQKLTVSVMDLNVTSGLSKSEVAMLTDKLLNEFVTNGYFKVVERSKRDEILKEQGFQQSGACDASACIVEAGQLLGVQKMFGGTIGKMGNVYAVELRMMDVKTGEIDMAFSRQYTGDVSALLGAMKEATQEFSKWKPKLVATSIADYGGIKIISTPSGAKVYLDGNESGLTPCQLDKIEIGEHQIVIVKEGFSQQSNKIKITKNGNITVNATLNKEYGSLHLTTVPPDAKISIDGLFKSSSGLAGFRLSELSAGLHKIKITKAGYETYEVDLTIEQGEENRLNAVLTPKAGVITLSSSPSEADVFVDDMPKGQTPCVVKILDPGQHTVKIEKEGYEGRSLTMDIGSGESIAKHLELIKAATQTASPAGGIKKVGKETVNQKDGSVLIEIPAGDFIMGSDEGTSELKPVHTVYLDKYYLGKHEVTLGQYKKFCKETGRWLPEQPDWNQGDDSPVVNVSWIDAKAYCDWAGLRLPTEAEWEKAARGCAGMKYPWGNDWNPSKCNSSGNGDVYINTSPVGSTLLGASPYGICDMIGNVWEWCNDFYAWNYYTISPITNPKGPASGPNRVLRGGCWYTTPLYMHAYDRSSDDPERRDSGTGFRVAK